MRSLKSLQESIYWQEVILTQSKDQAQIKRAKQAIERLKGEVLTHSLVLAITAPSDKEAKKAVALAETLANGLLPETVEQSKQKAMEVTQ